MFDTNSNPSFPANSPQKFDTPPASNLNPFSKVGDSAGGALHYNAFSYNDLIFGDPEDITAHPDTPPYVISEDISGSAQPYWRPINNSVISFDEKSIAYACYSAFVGWVSVPIAVKCTI